jgi:hypothetical protein
MRMVDKNKVRETADKYVERMKSATDEAKKALDKSLSDMDRIGNEMYEDMRVDLKDSGIDIDKMQAKMRENLSKGKDELMKDFWQIQSRMVRFGEDMEKEIRRTFKQP